MALDDFAKWWEKAISGDSEAWRVIVNEYTPLLYGYAYNLLANGPDVEEAVGETWREVFANRHRYDTSRSFDSWVIGILSFNCKDELRLRGRIATLQGDIADESKRAPVLLCEQERLERLAECVDKLSDAEKRLIELKYWHSAKEEEICVELGLADRNESYRCRKAAISKLLLCLGFGHE